MTLHRTTRFCWKLIRFTFFAVVLISPIVVLLTVQKRYVDRGVEPMLARQVAEQLMSKDALGAHAREELGITPNQAAKPLQAALTSAATFAVGAAIPLLTAFLIPRAYLIPAVVAISLIFLAALGGVAARTGGANPWVGAARVAFWSALAMGVTAGVGALFGVSV